MSKVIFLMSLITFGVVTLFSGCVEITTPMERQEIKALIESFGDEESISGFGTIHMLSSYGHKAVPFLIDRLGDENELVREGVIEVLKRMRSEVSPQLVRLVADEDPLVRRGAISILRPISYDDMSVISALHNALGDRDQAVRFGAAFALAAVGFWPDRVTPLLIEAANSEDSYFRTEAVQAFIEGNKYPIEALPGFISMLPVTGDDHTCGSRALEEVGQKIVLAFIRLLRNKDPKIRDELFKAFRAAGFDPNRSMSLLAALLYSDDLKVKSKAAYSIGFLGPEAAEAIPALIRTLWDKHPGVRWNVATALGKIGAEASASLPILKEISEVDVSGDIRLAASEAISRIEPAAADPVPILVKMLRSNDEKMRGLAVRILKVVGPNAIDAVPVLCEMMHELENLRLGPEIASALSTIRPDPDDVLPTLSILLLDVDYSVVETAIHALEAIGGDPVPHIAEYISGSDPYLVALVLRSTSGIGRTGEDAFPVFVEKMKGNDFGLRMGADAILNKTYPDLSYALSVYRELTMHEDPVVRQYGIFLMGVHNPKPSEVVPIISEFLTDEDIYVRSTAAATLGYMGPGVKEVVPDLVRMLDDDSEFVVSMAVFALGYMEEAATVALPKLRSMYKETKPEDQKFLWSELRYAIKSIEYGTVNYRRRFGPEVFDDL